MKTWVKQSYGPTGRRVNATRSSAALSDPYELVDIDEQEAGVSPYEGFWTDSQDSPQLPVHQCLQVWTDSHDDVCSDINTWICRLFELQEEEQGCVAINSCMPPEYLCSLWTTGNTRPDVAYYTRAKKLIVQIEVLSSTTRDTTILKLAFGLSKQNRYDRNLDSCITQCTGFFFPVGSGVVERVDCTWNDHALRYDIKCTKIAKNDLEQTFRCVVTEAKRKIRTCRTAAFTNFTLPLTQHYIHDTFGQDFFQVPSGDAVVLMNDRVVYKCPLSKRARSVLQAATTDSCLQDLRHTAVPQRCRSINRQSFYQFRAYKPPLMIEEVKAHIVPFVKTVVLAITELHSSGNSQLDSSLVHVNTVQARNLPSLHESALDCKGRVQGVHLLACCPCVRGHSLARERAYVRGACQCTG